MNGIERVLFALSLPALTLLFLIYERRDGRSLRCVFRDLTGLYCPGCGSGRALYALTHGQLHDVWHYNILFVVLGVPCAVILVHEYLRLSFPRLGLRPVMISQRLLYGAVGLIVVFWILRNIPAFSFLAPGS